MRALLLLAALAALVSPYPGWAADGDELTCDRDGGPWACKRFLIADSDTGTVASSPVVTLTWGQDSLNEPVDFANFWVDYSEAACTSFTVDVETQYSDTAAECETTCDWHVVVSLSDTGSTAKAVNFPLGKSVRTNITAINSCTISVLGEFYRRHQGR